MPGPGEESPVLPAAGGWAAWASVTRRNRRPVCQSPVRADPVSCPRVRRRLVTRPQVTSASVHTHPQSGYLGWWPRVSAGISEAVAAFLVRLPALPPLTRHCLQTSDPGLSRQSPDHSLMAGYELPVTRVPGLGSMDQIGAALGSGPATDYLGNIITRHNPH